MYKNPRPQPRMGLLFTIAPVHQTFETVDLSSQSKSAAKAKAEAEAQARADQAETEAQAEAEA